MVGLQARRRQRYMSIRELATAAGVSPATIVNIEAGAHQPRYGTMRRIAAALASEPDEIDEFRRADAYWAGRRAPTAPSEEP